MEITVFTMFIGASLLSILTKYKDPQNSYRLFKLIPITILLVWMVDNQSFINPYSKAILIGLCFSALGDFLLLFPTQFKSGIFSFLTGHVWYIFAFSSGNWMVPIIPSTLILLFCLTFLSKLIPNAESLKLPVFVYILVISTMGLAAFGRHEFFNSNQSLICVIGAVLFMISDSVLGWNKFIQPFPSAEAIVLSTYYLGQGMIALSTI